MKTRKQRALYIAEKLDELYPEVAIPLRHTNPYTLLVAVILSAQCTDKRVNEVSPALFKKATSPQHMLRLGANAIKDIIKPCGLANSKSKALCTMSRQLLEAYDGCVPASFEALESLAGVGHKTASVVMAQAFGQPAFPVDTHIHRLAQRWRLTSGKNVTQTEKDLKKLFPPDEWHRRHLQFIFYGREYCTARGCDGTVCALCRGCFPNRKRPVECRK